MNNKKILTNDALKESAYEFTKNISSKRMLDIEKITDGKAVGNFLENEFKDFLKKKFTSTDWGNSAKGIDLPTINTDIKFTSYKQPQSSLPFRTTAQKIFGLGYNLIIFVYNKDDDRKNNLQFSSVTFIDSTRTGDYTLTRVLRDSINCNANYDDIYAILTDRCLPGDDLVYNDIIKRIIENNEIPEEGYLTISNALQWRAQYKHAIDAAEQGNIKGVEKLNV